MPVVINGSTGISGTDGSASTPAIQGTDTNTGMFFPAADTIAFAEGGTEVMRIAATGNVGIGGTPSSDTTYKWLNIVGPTTSGGGLVQLNNSDSSVGINMFCNNLAGYMGTSTAHPFLFRVNSSEVARIDTSGNWYMNSGYGSVAVAYGCRSWVNFNGTGTVAIRASGNVSSITDNAASDYTVNFTTTMPDANYCVTALSSTDGGNQAVSFQVFPSGAVPTTSSVRLKNYTTNTGQVDSAYCYVAIFR